MSNKNKAPKLKTLAALTVLGATALGIGVNSHDDSGAEKRPSTVTHRIDPTTTTTHRIDPTTTTEKLAEKTEFSPEDWESLKNSTVLLATPQKGPIANMRLRMIDGKAFVTGPEHAVGIEEPSAIEQVPLESTDGYEITKKLKVTYQILDPVTLNQIAELDRVAVSGQNSDLLVATTRNESAAFKEKTFIDESAQPQTGDVVAIYGASEANKYKPIARTGVDLGAYNFTQQNGMHFDVRLIGLTDANADVGLGQSGNQPMSLNGSYGPQRASLGRGTSDEVNNWYFNDINQKLGINLQERGIKQIIECIDVTNADWTNTAAPLS